MANLGGNHDGTVSGDAGADATACDNGGLDLVQRLDDAVLPLGRNGGNDMLSPAFGVNGAHPYYGPGYVPSAGGNGRLEHQIVPTSQLAAEVNQRIHGGQTGPLDQLRGRSAHEWLGPQVGFNHNPETGAFHTPPGLPPGAGYGHAPTAPQFPLVGENAPGMFVPTTTGSWGGSRSPKSGPSAGISRQSLVNPGWHSELHAGPGGCHCPSPRRPGPFLVGTAVCCPPRTGSPSRTVGSPLRFRSLDGGRPTARIWPPPCVPDAPGPPAAPYAGAPVPAPPAFGRPFPRTGFDYTRLQMPGAPAPPAPRQTTFSAPFVPVQPPKPLLIDDFLTVYAVHALKSAPNRLLFDNTTGSISFQPDMTGVSAKKIKCPDLPALLKASERIKSALLQLGAIQGPDYDRYQDSCMTLLLDPKCGGNGWPFETFMEFNNAHRLQQWTTGASFDILCPMRMAHFAAMAASRANKSGQSFLDSRNANKRSAGGSRGPRGPRSEPRGGN
jgi:hypothetical protein